MEYPVLDKLGTLRDAVNESEVQERLMQNMHHWQQLCSSMDVIGDTESAIAAFNASSSVQDVGLLYLHTYGLLQVLFVQQDAIKHAAEAIGMSHEFTEELKTLRHVRNNAIGHPTKRGGKNSESFGIVQASLSHEGFTLYSFDWDKPGAFQPINFQELISVQSAAVAEAIEKMIGHLRVCAAGDVSVAASN